MSNIANHGSAELTMIEVPAGKQSADMHIGSYLSYLAGINRGNDCRYIIISRDTDFDNVIKFWKKKAGINASRAVCIKDAPAKPAAKTAEDIGIRQILAYAGMSEVLTGYVDTLIKNTVGKDRKQRIRQELIAEYGKDMGPQIYNLVKGEIK